MTGFPGIRAFGGLISNRLSIVTLTGDMEHGFARVKCKDCGHEYVLAFSCKRRQFLPFLPPETGCGIRGTALHGRPEKGASPALCVQHPQDLRGYFLYERKLISRLSRCAWESLKVFIQQAVPEQEPIPGAVIACR